MSNDKILQDKYFKIQIMGDDWSVYLISDNDNHLLDIDEYGSTSFENKEIYIRKATLQIITHELIHAFVYYSFTETCELTALQNEELMSEIISWNWDKLAKLRIEIYNKLMELK